ncbi:MAG: YjiH family protein, partial [Gammaproteobacteria bacterium]|nr:YjiH family protein [Gammaproteobacteria bacterium]
MTPFSFEGSLTIPIAVASKALQNALADSIGGIITAIILFTGLLSLITTVFKPKLVTQHSFFNGLFSVTPVWLVVRLLGAAFVGLTFFGVGPEMIVSGNTGGLILNDLLPSIFSVFIFAGMLMPLLMNFGLLEFIGTLLTRIMRPVFNLPGRSAVDCMASWLGDGSVAILMTSKQYEGRVYTQREAAVVGTTFSAVSITFSLVVITQVKLEHMFIPFYLTVCFAGIVAAIIVPKLPPLSWKKDRYIDDTERHVDAEVIPSQHNVFTWSFHQALDKAQHAQGGKATLVDGVKNVVDMVFGVIPVVMGIGTVALIIAEYTPVFNYLGMPFIPLLEILQVPEAVAASKTIVVGFADMFIPSILAG